MSDAVFRDPYDDMEVSPRQVREENPSVLPPETPQVRRSMSMQDMMPPAWVKGAQTELLKTKIAADQAAGDFYRSRQEEDRARALKADNAIGVEAGRLQPWDADAARDKYKTDPLASFGSIGSVFAMVAAAFTHAPMVNALNGGAAAMNAIKEGNDKDYDRAFAAFKENNDLAIKRANLMSHQYQNAMTLMSKDMEAGRNAFIENATKYGDARMLTLVEAGMDKEALEFAHSQISMAKDLEAVNKSGLEYQIQSRAYEAAEKRNSQVVDPNIRDMLNQQAYERIFKGMKLTAEQEMVQRWSAENPEGSAEQLRDFMNVYHQRSMGLGSNAQNLQTYIAAVTEQHPEWTDTKEGQAKILAMAQQQMAAATQKPGSVNAAFSAEKKKAILDDVKQEHPDWTPGQQALEADKREKQAINVLTKNKQITEQAHIDKFGFAIQTIDKIVDPVSKKLGPVGLPGYAMRLGERLGNFVGGSKSATYVQLSRDIDLLKQWGTENLLDRSGRPLSAEHAQMNNIIAGMSMGDTVANTLKAYKDLKALYIQMRDAAVRRLGGNWEAPAPGSGAPNTPAPVASPKAQPWLDAPLVK